MKFRTRLRPSSSLIDLTPLVDVVFLLLIFFMISSDIMPLKSLHVENPTLDKDSPPLSTQLLVVMDKHHVIYLGARKELVDLGELRERLDEEVLATKEAHPGSEPCIVLSVDRQVEYGAFLKLFASAQDCASKVRLVYRSSGDPLPPT